VGAVCTKEAVTAGDNAPLTYGKETESNDYFGITYSQAVTYFSLECSYICRNNFKSTEKQKSRTTNKTSSFDIIKV
jgi:hypothetical protein